MGMLEDREESTWTRVRIQTETYGFARQRTRGGSGNLILISDMSFLVDFRPEKASGRGHKNSEGYSDSALITL